MERERWGSGNAGRGPRLREASGRTRGHRKCSSGINKAIVDYGSDIAPELRSSGARKRESRARRGARGIAEGQGEDGPGSVGDSRATSMIVVVVLDDGGGRPAVEWVGGGRRGNAEEEEAEEEEEDDEIERRGELTFSCAGKVRQSLTDRLT